MPDHDKRLEQARRRAEGLAAIRLRYCINTHLDDRGIATPAGLAQATGLPAFEAAGLLRRKQWRAGDLAPCRRSPTASVSRCPWRASTPRPVRPGHARSPSYSPGGSSRTSAG